MSSRWPNSNYDHCRTFCNHPRYPSEHPHGALCESIQGGSYWIKFDQTAFTSIYNLSFYACIYIVYCVYIYIIITYVCIICNNLGGWFYNIMKSNKSPKLHQPRGFCDRRCEPSERRTSPVELEGSKVHPAVFHSKVEKTKPSSFSN